MPDVAPVMTAILPSSFPHCAFSSTRSLIQALKEMELDGIVTRKDFREVPPRVEYSLTAFGRDRAEASRPLCEWGNRHLRRIGKLPTQCALAKRPVKHVE
jgi:DNA-binding HxlR family transcriptional regulator